MIPYAYLLDRPWSELNCAEVVRTALNGWLEKEGDERRVSEWDLPSNEIEAQDALARLREGIDTRWLWRGDDATKAQVGDVVLTYGIRGPHVALAVGSGIALTSSQERGTYAIGLQFLAGVQGVYRLA